jgi:hypothetical protein
LLSAGTAVIAALRHPEASLNKFLRVASFIKTSNQVLSEYERQVGVKFHVKNVPLADHEAVERKMWEEVNPWGTVATLRRIWATGDAMYDTLSNESMGLNDGDKDSLEAAVQKHINMY